MAINLKSHLTNNATLKVTSCILGYAFWTILSQSHIKTIEVEVPVCFYGNSSYTYCAPATLHVTLAGKRTDLRCINPNTLAVHVDAQELKVGTHKLHVDNTTLFLPDTIKLVNYFPANCAIKVDAPASQELHEKDSTQLVAMNEEPTVDVAIEILKNNTAPTVQA